MSRRQKPQPNRQPLLLPSQRTKQASASLGENADSANQRTQRDAASRAFSKAASHSQPHGGTATQSVDTASAGLAALPLGPGVRLVAFHPCGLYVLEKPEGILSHPNKKSETGRSLLCAPYSLEHEYFYNLHTPDASTTAHTHTASSTSAAEALHPNTAQYPIEHTQDIADKTPLSTVAAAAVPEKLYLLHRLDSATSGLLLLADNEALANNVRAAFTEGGVRKTYFALCAATSPMRTGQKGRWSDRLQREHSGAGGSIVSVRTSNSGMSAVTDFICRKTTPASHSLALLELQPISGRTHQLRVHCAQHGLPIIGDGKYGEFRLNRDIAKASGYKRLFLHAAALELNFNHKGMPLRLRFSAAPPAEFDALLHNPPELNRATPRQGTTGRAAGATGKTGATGSRSDKVARSATRHGKGKR